MIQLPRQMQEALVRIEDAVLTNDESEPRPEQDCAGDCDGCDLPARRCPFAKR